MPMAMAFFLLLLFFFSFLFSRPISSQPIFPNRCEERCGDLVIPFPFHLNSSCGPPIDAFRLSCSTSSSLFLTLGGPTGLRIMSFLPSGSVLVDYSHKSNSSSSSSSSSCDRWYSSSIFGRSPFFAVTAANVLRLYDCEDSSVCKQGCERAVAGGCDGRSGCCYPLSDGSVWKPGDGFSVFSEFGCRGFSSWAVDGEGPARRGMEMEWAVPRGFLGNGSVGGCAEGAVAVNATGVRGGVRCACRVGLVGDGFAAGAGCFKACSIDGYTYGGDCCEGRLCKKRAAVLVGLLVSAFFLAAAVIGCCLLLRRPTRANQGDAEPACLPRFLGKACRTRLFTYQELDEATRGFEQDKDLGNVSSGTIHPGVLGDGSLVAIQKVECGNQQNLMQILERVELLSRISHKNIARVLGCCIGSGFTVVLVHEFFPGGTLEELLQSVRGTAALSWYRRINIATEVASALAHLQAKMSPPINLCDLKSSDILFDTDYSVKIAGFKFLDCEFIDSYDSRVAYNFGLILLELIMDSRHENRKELVLPMIRDNRFHEIVDPNLKFGQQLLVQCKEIEMVASFAVLCLTRSENCRELSMVGVAKEFIRIVSDNCGSSSATEPVLEVTFSNSSLLQMISMSPDSLLKP